MSWAGKINRVIKHRAGRVVSGNRPLSETRYAAAATDDTALDSYFVQRSLQPVNIARVVLHQLGLHV